jgi:hypothetical protein
VSGRAALAASDRRRLKRPGSVPAVAAAARPLKRPGSVPAVAAAVVPVLALAGLLCALAAPPAGADDSPPEPTTADAVIARYVEARGGLAAWDALRTLEVRGTYTAFSEEAPFTLRRRRPAAYRFETRMFGDDVVEAFDGEAAGGGGAGWVLDPVGGYDWPLPMKPAEMTAAWTLADFDSPLVRFREKGHAVELAGRDDLDGQAVWRLELTRKDGAKETWFLDAATFLEVCRIAPVVDYGAPFEQKIYYSDFRPVGGVLFPHHVESEYFIRLRIAAIDEIRVNPELDAALFALPADPAWARLAPLAGAWTVTVETRAHPRAPWQAATTTSTIEPAAGGAVLAERIAYVVDGRTLETTRLWSWDRFQAAYRLATADDFTGHLNVFAGAAGDDGSITLSNAETGTAWKTTDGAVTERHVLRDLAPDAFKLDLEQSTDGGATWTTAVRFSYGRQP